jgi:predicted sugar kinase
MKALIPLAPRGRSSWRYEPGDVGVCAKTAGRGTRSAVTATALTAAGGLVLHGGWDDNGGLPGRAGQRAVDQVRVNHPWEPPG